MARPGKNNPTGAQKSPKRTPEVLLKLEKAFSLGCSTPEACFYAGLSATTFYEWMGDEPKLSDRLKSLKNKPILKARQTVVDSLGDPKNAQWYLERKLKNEFSLKSELDHTSSDGSMTPSIDTKKLSLKTLTELLEAKSEPQQKKDEADQD